MTHQYTKLADALENIAQMEYPSAHHDGKNLREAAALLRAAAGVDVAGLMAMVKEHALNCYELGAIKSDVKNHAQQRMKVAGFYAALESALRMALAGREGFVLVPRESVEQIADALADVLATFQHAEPEALKAAIQHSNRSAHAAYTLVYRLLAAAPKGTP